MFRPQLKIFPGHCSQGWWNDWAMSFEPMPKKVSCGERHLPSYDWPAPGWLIENPNEERCIHKRPVYLYVNGVLDADPETAGRKVFGELWGQSAYFTDNTEEGWAPGRYEVVAPGLSFHEKVYKDDGTPQDKAKSYTAKVICERLTLTFPAPSKEES